MPTRRKEEYPECLEEKKKQHGKKEGIGIVVNKCLEDECPLKEECRSYLVYPAIGNKEFAENMMSILHKQ